MSELIEIIAITAGAFFATNLDNLVLLVALYARYDRHSALVTAGYFTGALLIGSISLAIGEAGEFIPLEYLGFLGVIPVMIGVIALVNLFRHRAIEDADQIPINSSGQGAFGTTLTTQLSNGTDTILTFSIILADSKDAMDYRIIPAFVFMTAVFAVTAYYSLRHRWLSNFLSRYGHYLTPFILIFIGCYVLANTATDLMPG